MNAILFSALLLAPQLTSTDSFTAPTPVAQICVDSDGQRPMPGDPPLGPPVVCVKEYEADFPMKHGSCGTNCNFHMRADDAKAPKVPVRFELFCPVGIEVRSLSYQLEGQAKVDLASGGTGSSSFFESRELPLSKTKVEAACRNALGVSWPNNGSHANTKQKVETKLKSTISLWGRCGANGPLQSSKFQIGLTVTCEDRDF